MDTNLTVKEIENALVFGTGMFSVRNDIIIPNLSWGLLNHEADLAVINKTGYLTEIEIKRSIEDLRADFKKKEYHCDEKVYKFYYCIPVGIKDKAIELFRQNQEKIMKLLGQTIYNDPALLLYDEKGHITQAGGYPYKSGRKLFLEERLTAARLASCRLWDMRRKQIIEKQQPKLDF